MTSEDKKTALKILDSMEKMLTDLYGVMPALATPLLQKLRILRGLIL